MHSQRLAMYVTLLPDSKTVEWYAVLDNGDGRSDLWSDGCSSASKVPLELFDSFTAWLWARTAAD